MLSVRNLQGEEEGLVGLQNLSRNRKINGEKVISLTVMPNNANEHSYNMFEEESIVYFEDEPYVVKKMNEKSLGKTTIKRGDAIHKFYVDMINKQQHKVHNGSITFKRYMEEFVFEGTGIEVVLIDSFPARAFENLGNDNRLSLLSKGIDRYKAEFELVGNQARFKHQIGSLSDFQFRYGHNITAINVDVDTTNLATVIRGTGDPELGIEAYYRSDNADIFGELDAPSVDDERFKREEALLDEMKSRLLDTPEFSLQIDFADLRAAGYPYTVPNEGDSVFVIYEPMNDLKIETRILNIDEVFDKDLKVIKTVVTLANYKKSLAGTLFEETQKQLKGIVDDDGIIKYSVLDEAVRIATESLQSAQTELLFENGIIAREKDDPNRLVVLNSKGLGISKTGGFDFTEAITADGFVLSAGAIGRLKANNIQVGPETSFDGNYDPSKKETPEEAERKIKEMKDQVDEDLGVVSGSLGDLDEYIDHAFKDGVIEEAEAKAIEKYINSLESEKGDVDAQYTAIYTNTHLSGAPKTNLLNAKVNYNGAHNELIAAINSAIADGKTTIAEKENVDTKFLAYRNTLANLAKRFEQAIDTIAQNKADVAEDNAKGHADGKDSTLRDNLRLTAPLPTSIGLGNNGITASTSTPGKYARLDYRGLYIRGGAIQIDGGLTDSQIASSADWNGAASEVNQNKDTWSRASFLNADGTFNSSKLKGKLTDAQLASAAQWNGQGTYIGSDGIYTGVVVASQVISGVLDTDKITIKGGDSSDYTQIDGSEIISRGRFTRTWFGETTTANVAFRFKNGYLRVENFNENKRLYYSDKGISTFLHGYDDEDPNSEYHGSGVIEFFSHQYESGARGLTLFSNRGTIGLRTESKDVILDAYRNSKMLSGSRGSASFNYLGSDLGTRITDLNTNSGSGDISYRPIQALAFQERSSKKVKKNIKKTKKKGLEMVNRLRIVDYDYNQHENDSDKGFGVIAEDSPDISKDGEFVDLGALIYANSLAIQELSAEIKDLKGGGLDGE